MEAGAETGTLCFSFNQCFIVKFYRQCLGKVLPRGWSSFPVTRCAGGRVGPTLGLPHCTFLRHCCCPQLLQDSGPGVWVL